MSGANYLGQEGVLTHREVKAIRQKLGFSHEQLAEALALSGAHAAKTVREWEMDPSRAKSRAISGSAAMAMLAFLEGFAPPDDEQICNILFRHGIADE